MTASTPATIDVTTGGVSLAQSTVELGQKAIYTISFNNINILPVGGSIRIRYWDKVSPATIPLTTCTVIVVTTQYISNCVVDLSNNQIKLMNLGHTTDI
jgi:hypothetical protein